MRTVLSLTHNAPSQNMKKTINFFLGDSSMLKTMGNGKHRTRTSSAKLLPTCAKPMVVRSYRILAPCHDSEMGSKRVMRSLVKRVSDVFHDL